MSFSIPRAYFTCYLPAQRFLTSSPLPLRSLSPPNPNPSFLPLQEIPGWELCFYRTKNTIVLGADPESTNAMVLGGFRHQQIPRDSVFPRQQIPWYCFCPALTTNMSCFFPQTMWVLFPEQGQLATITAQCNESDYAKVGKTIDSLIASVTKKK